MSLKEMCSLKDCTELRELIIRNPELPLLVFCGEESWNGEYAYSQAEYNDVRVEEVTLYNEYWLEKDDYIEHRNSYNNEDIQKQRETKIGNKMIEGCIGTIREQPTAYDLDKVIAQLDEKIARLDSRQQICYEVGDFKTGDKMVDKMAAFIESKNIVKKEVKK